MLSVLQDLINTFLEWKAKQLQYNVTDKRDDIQDKPIKTVLRKKDTDV
jgi:hypothetical protein